MQARIWNETKGTYDPYELPEGSSKYENNYFDENGNCNCELIVMDRILLQELVDKTTWVPVKKGLPDDRQVVLTIKNKHISILEYHADTKHWFETRGNWWWSYNMVDAWMPLPKPYLGSER